MKIKLLISVIITVLAGIFASQHPDGLDKVSEVLGFGHKGIENSAIMAGYNVSFLGSSKLSTIAAGITGVLFIYCLFQLIRLAAKK
jgi:hypothetical protein